MDIRILNDYRYYLKIERSMSPNTVSAYSKDVSAFLDWVDFQSVPERSTVQADAPGPSSPHGTAALSRDAARPAGKKLSGVCTDDIISYLQFRNVPGAGMNVSRRTQARILSSLRSFFSWLMQEGYIRDNPCDGVDAPKIGRYLPEVLSVKEVGQIMDAVPLTDWLGLRDRAILEMLYGCGLRVSEASGLKISDLFFDEGFVRIIGKGNKERVVPVGEMAMDAVRDYLDVRPGACPSLCPSSGGKPADPAVPASDSRNSISVPSRFDDILFLNSRGSQLSRISIFNMVKHYAMLAGITKEISPHTFRHSFATHLIENGADLRVVQEMLGHESILTTEIYTHINKATWQSSILSHHPRR